MTASSENVTNMNPSDQDKPFRLFDLPAEIWSKIGKLAIDNSPCLTGAIIAQADTSEDTTYWRDLVEETLPPPSDRSAARQPAITQTCRILRQELLAYYYQTKAIFHGNDNSDTLRSAGQWLRCIGVANRRNVSGITIMTDWNEDPKEQQEGMSDPYWKGIDFQLVKVRSHVVDGDGYAWDKYKVVFL